MLVPWLSTLLILGCSGSGLINAASLRGCKFDRALCHLTEVCFDDGAFGLCIDPRRGPDRELWIFNLDDRERAIVSTELEPFVERTGNYPWRELYFQCVVDRVLLGLRHQTYPVDYSACEVYREERATAKGTQDGDPTLATIRFSPSDTKYADEVYYPAPGRDKQPSRLDILALAMGEAAKKKPHQLSTTRLSLSPVFYDKYYGELPELERLAARRDKKFRRSLEPGQVQPDQPGAYRHLESHRPASDFLHKQYNTPQRFRAGFESRDDDPVDLDFALSLLPGNTDMPPELHTFTRKYNTPKSFRQGLEYHEPGQRFLDEMRIQDEPEVMEAEDEEESVRTSFLRELAAAEREAEAAAEAAAEGADEEWGVESSLEPSVGLLPQRFSQRYNTPDSFRAGLETKDVREDDWRDNPDPTGTVFIRPNRARGDNTDSETESRWDAQLERNDIPDLEDQQEPPLPRPSQERARETDQAKKELTHLLQVYLAASGPTQDVPEEIQAEEDEVDQAPGRAYTEGGLVFLPDKQTDSPESLGLGSLISDWRAFQRRERLDVKKPGPQYNINNYAFRKAQEEKAKENSVDLPEPREAKGEPKAEAIYGSPPVSVMQHKPLHAANAVIAPNDSDVVNVKFKEGIPSRDEGERIISILATSLSLTPSAFGRRRIDGKDVSFKVDSGKTRLNASEVVKQILEGRDDIQKRIGVAIESAAAGHAQPLVQEAFGTGWRHDSLMLGGVVAGVTVGAALISAVTYLVIRRMYRTREKQVHGMTAPDTEASKDYQDLCRARMAKKAEAERSSADPLHMDQRVASLSRESECSNNSPSSRSSTSSWTEEPALTNMDISTGHMVLAYMEDHLKNKDRLEQEWQGLCAYEAEPCETTVAQKPENVKKNRYYPHVLPYDHSRVVLNELANATGSDYINASTITDHDPRNPAYLATQGPLPHTAADLWQLVWEQGSVVMVMLTRLTENGTAMCHRYWPEEGSELYHIYEVHLVSEHIWCDDYLVRSFYLKNLKTGETRTVTQFHFLSWPDHGVPPSTKPLLDFRRKVNKSYRGRSCPIVVHCSDGAGRTGTYSLIDMVLNRMAKGAKEIDIAATLEHIRDQRANMVESREQFEFCLQAVADEVHAILKALPAQPTPPPSAVGPQPPSPTPSPPAPATKQQEQQPKKKT